MVIIEAVRKKVLVCNFRFFFLGVIAKNAALLNFFVARLYLDCAWKVVHNRWNYFCTLTKFLDLKFKCTKYPSIDQQYFKQFLKVLEHHHVSLEEQTLIFLHSYLQSLIFLVFLPSKIEVWEIKWDNRKEQWGSLLPMKFIL